MQVVKFFFDPRCPWCYQTSKWANRLEELGEIELDWGVFSLEVLNRAEGVDPMSLLATGSPQLRTAVAISRAHGSRVVGRFYAELGSRTFERAAAADPAAAHDIIRDSLRGAGLDPALLDAALDDDSTWREIVDTTVALHDRLGDVGVPTIVLDGGDGPAIFGPVIVSLPNDADAVELWRHTEWLTRYENFAELKRKRSGRPDLPSIEFQARQRAAEGGRS